MHAFQDCLKSSWRKVSTGKNVHRPDDGMLHGLLLDQKREVLPEPLHLRPFQSSGWDKANLKTVCLKLEFALNFIPSEPTVVAAILRP